MPHVSDASPAVSYLGRMRAAVCEFQHGILLPWIEVRRLDHHGLHNTAIARFHLQQIGLSQLVLLQRIDPILFNNPRLLPVSIIEPRWRWCVYVAPIIDEDHRRGTESQAV